MRNKAVTRERRLERRSAPLLHRFGQMRRADLLDASEVGDGAGDVATA
jgi:hypothetical protein